MKLLLAAITLVCASLVLAHEGHNHGGLASSGATLLGDVNLDGASDISDLVLLAREALFRSPVAYSSLACPGAGDATRDGYLCPCDVGLLAHRLFGGGSIPMEAVDCNSGATQP